MSSRGIEAKRRGDAVPDQFQDEALDFFRVLLIQKIKVFPMAGFRAPARQLALIDAVGVHHDQAVFGLAEDFGQFNDRHYA